MGLRIVARSIFQFHDIVAAIMWERDREKDSSRNEKTFRSFNQANWRRSKSTNGEEKRERERVIFFLSFSLSFFGSAREETGFRSVRFCAVYLAGWRKGRGGGVAEILLFSKLHLEEVSGDGCYRGEDGLRKNRKEGGGKKVHEWGREGTRTLTLARVPCAN